MIFNLSLLKSQDLQLTNFKIQENYNKDCDTIKSCIDSIKQIDNSLFFVLYLKDQSKYTPERILLHEMKNDTLYITYYSKPHEKDSIVFNEVTNNYDTLKYFTQSISLLNPLENACRIYSFEFSGINNIPKCFLYNNEEITTCAVNY